MIFKPEINGESDDSMVDDATGGLRLHRVFNSFGNIVDETHYDTDGVAVIEGQAGYLDEAFAYTGRMLDEYTGLQNNLNRWYDASVGRWLSEDPIGFAAGDANLYRYVGNGPVNGTDPRGLQATISGGGFDYLEGTPWGQPTVGGDGIGEAQDFFTKCLRDIMRPWEEQAKEWAKEKVFGSTLGPSIGSGTGRQPVFKCKVKFSTNPKEPGINFEWTW